MTREKLAATHTPCLHDASSPDRLELLGGVGQVVAVPDFLVGGGAPPRLEAAVPVEELGVADVLLAVAGPW